MTAGAGAAARDGAAIDSAAIAGLPAAKPAADPDPMQKRPPPTLAEVAKVAGVSVMTASRALSGKPGVSAERREEILRVADEMGYVLNRVAQRLSGGSTRILGVVTELNSPFAADLVLGMGTVARAADYEMLVYALSDRDRQPPGNILDLMRQFADGLVVILPYAADYLAAMASAHIPIVTIDQGGPSPFPTVTADNYQGGCAALRHLVELGHSRIGFIGGDERLASARDRHRAYADVLQQARLPVDPALLVEGDFSRKGGFDAALRLFRLPEPPTAIFAVNDVSAHGALAAAREVGLRVPEDLSIVGFDDIPLAAHATPPLTTIRLPLQPMARAAVNMLLAMIAGVEPPSAELVLPTQLVVRGSTRPPRR